MIIYLIKKIFITCRLAGPRGIAVVQKSFKDTRFRGKGHEKEDLDILLKRLEHWAHRLFPKLPFKDTLEQLEKLGSKKNVQVHYKAHGTRVTFTLYMKFFRFGSIFQLFVLRIMMGYLHIFVMRCKKLVFALFMFGRVIL